jgi:hypothetical protein
VHVLVAMRGITIRGSLSSVQSHKVNEQRGSPEQAAVKKGASPIAVFLRLRRPKAPLSASSFPARFHGQDGRFCVSFSQTDPTCRIAPFGYRKTRTVKRSWTAGPSLSHGAATSADELGLSSEQGLPPAGTGPPQGTKKNWLDGGLLR